MLLKKKNNLLLLFFAFTFCAFAQKAVSVYKTDGLLKRINNKSDTIYVVNFWATWCKPCVAELPEFEKFNKQNKTRIVKVLLVSMDFKEDMDKKLVPFLEKNKYSMECILLDEVNGNDFINKINLKWSGAIPATLFTTQNKSKEHFLEKKLSLEMLNETLSAF